MGNNDTVHTNADNPGESITTAKTQMVCIRTAYLLIEAESEYGF